MISRLNWLIEKTFMISKEDEGRLNFFILLGKEKGNTKL
jgi:hypothetical protein